MCSTPACSRDDISLCERAVWDKIASGTIEGCTLETASAGLEMAPLRIELALAQVRAQAEAVSLNSAVKDDPQQECALPVLH